MGSPAGGSLPDRMDVLVAEPEPKPGVDQHGIRGGNHRVVRGEAVVDPAGRGGGVEVADELRAVGRLPGRVDPDVRAPGRLARPPEQEARDPAVEHGGRARRALDVAQLVDLPARHIGVFVAGVEAGLDEPLRPVSLREQPRGAVEVLFAERDDGGRAGGGRVGHGARLERRS